MVRIQIHWHTQAAMLKPLLSDLWVRAAPQQWRCVRVTEGVEGNSRQPGMHHNPGKGATQVRRIDWLAIKAAADQRVLRMPSINIVRPGWPGSQSLAESFEPGVDPLAVHAEVAISVAQHWPQSSAQPEFCAIGVLQRMGYSGDWQFKRARGPSAPAGTARKSRLNASLVGLRSGRRNVRTGECKTGQR